MALKDELGKVAESAMDQISGTYQAFLYGYPMHTANYGTYNPDWFGPGDTADPTSFNPGDMDFGDGRHIMDGVGLSEPGGASLTGLDDGHFSAPELG